jgi:hypothetical protein
MAQSIQWVDSWQMQLRCLLSTALGPTSLLCSNTHEQLFPGGGGGVKWPGREANHSTTLSANVKNDRHSLHSPSYGSLSTPKGTT